MNNFYFHPFSTPFGEWVLVWSQETEVCFRRLFLEEETKALHLCREKYSGIRKGNCTEVRQMETEILNSFEGKPIAMNPENLLGFCSDFQKKVLLHQFQIPRGKICTYGDLALRVGKSGAFRAVGSALSRNPFPILIPCHRTILGNGNPGNYQGGTLMKVRLLAMEGVFLK